MSSFSAASAIPPVDPIGTSNPSALPSPEAPLAAQREAYSSEAGVTIRLLASLPANLGQNLDAAV